MGYSERIFAIGAIGHATGGDRRDDIPSVADRYQLAVDWYPDGLNDGHISFLANRLGAVF